MESVEINWLAVIVAALASFVIGGIWYGALFAKKWQKLVGLSDEEAGKDKLRVFGLSFVTSLVMALTLAFFIGSSADATFGTLAGFAVGFGWVAMAFGMNYLFEHRSFALYVINAGYNVVALTVMGFIIGVL